MEFIDIGNPYLGDTIGEVIRKLKMRGEGKLPVTFMFNDIEMVVKPMDTVEMATVRYYERAESHDKMAKLGRRIEALTSVLTTTRHLFQTIHGLDAVGGSDQRFVRKMKMHTTLYYGEIIALLDNVPIEEAYRRIFADEINNQPPDSIELPSGLVIHRTDKP